MALVKDQKQLISERWDRLKPVLYGLEPDSQELLAKYFTEAVGGAELGRLYGKSKQAINRVVSYSVKILKPYLHAECELKRVFVALPFNEAQKVIDREKQLFPDIKEKQIKIRRIELTEWERISPTLKNKPHILEMFKRYYVDGQEIVVIAREMNEIKETVLSALKSVGKQVIPQVLTPFAVVDVLLPVNEAEIIIEQSKQYLNN